MPLICYIQCFEILRVQIFLAEFILSPMLELAAGNGNLDVEHSSSLLALSSRVRVRRVRNT